MTVINDQEMPLLENVYGSFHIKSSEVLENFNPTLQNSLTFGLLVEIYNLDKTIDFF